VVKTFRRTTAGARAAAVVRRAVRHDILEITARVLAISGGAKLLESAFLYEK